MGLFGVGLRIVMMPSGVMLSGVIAGGWRPLFFFGVGWRARGRGCLDAIFG